MAATSFTIRQPSASISFMTSLVAQVLRLYLEHQTHARHACLSLLQFGYIQWLNGESGFFEDPRGPGKRGGDENRVADPQDVRGSGLFRGDIDHLAMQCARIEQRAVCENRVLLEGQVQ